MPETIDLMPDLPGQSPVAVIVRRSARARRLSLRVSRLDGRVTLTLPPRAPLREAQSFVEAKADWIRAAIDRTAPREVVDFASRLPVEGVERVVRPGDGRRVRLEGDTLWVPATTASVGRAVEAALKTMARDRLVTAVDRYAARVGRAPTGMTLRDTRSRWGSCSSAGALMFSWRLILAPPAALDYVAAHEVAHLRHMDHSPRFWGLVDALRPGWQAQRDWLRVQGAALHAYDFGKGGA